YLAAEAKRTCATSTWTDACAARILVRVVTRLGQFDFQSRLKTSVYRAAAHYLLDVKKSCVAKHKLSFIDRLAGAPYWAQVESLHQSYGEVLGITKAKEAVPTTASLLEALRVAQRAIGAYADGPLDEERAVLTEEVKIGCTLGLLQCLDR